MGVFIGLDGPLVETGEKRHRWVRRTGGGGAGEAEEAEEKEERERSRRGEEGRQTYHYHLPVRNEGEVEWVIDESNELPRGRYVLPSIDPTCSIASLTLLVATFGFSPRL